MGVPGCWLTTWPNLITMYLLAYIVLVLLTGLKLCYATGVPVPERFTNPILGFKVTYEKDRDNSYVVRGAVGGRCNGGNSTVWNLLDSLKLIMMNHSREFTIYGTRLARDPKPVRPTSSSGSRTRRIYYTLFHAVPEYCLFRKTYGRKHFH